MNIFGEKQVRNGFTYLYILLLAAYCIFYLTRHQHFLDWSLLSSADSEQFAAASFQKGLFNFDLDGTRYTLEENFEGSDVLQSPWSDWTFLFSWLGIVYLLVCVTYLKRFGFIFSNVLLIVFLVSLDIGSLGLFNFEANSKIPLALFIFVLVLPGYIFQAFLKETAFAIRLLVFCLFVAALGMLLLNQAPHAFDYLKATSISGFSILTFLFVAFVAEEILFTILYVITQSRGSGNQKHFVAIGLIYLGFVTLYFLKKAGIYTNTLDFLNPYFLLPISAAISLWSFKFKQEFFEQNVGVPLDVRHFVIGLGLVAFSFLSTSFVEGNDPAYESFHYLITYAHLGFGVMFFLYVIVNFIDALIGGHSVYRIVYKERNFPYATSKLVGFIAVAAFFFMASKEPVRLIQGARYNYLGDYEKQLDHSALANSYYEQGSIFAYNNHYSNYQLGLNAVRKGKVAEAVYRFEKAAQRYPTPQAYVNASVYVRKSNLPKAVSLLRTAEHEFGARGEINNNLANLLVTNGQIAEAKQLLESAPETGNWNMAPEVNKWRLVSDSGDYEDTGKNISETYKKANTAVKANMISYLLARLPEKSVPFDSTDINKQRMDLHSLVLLNNAAYLGQSKINADLFQTGIASTYNGAVQENLKFANLFDRYLNGDINLAYQLALEFEFSISTTRAAELQNLLGLMLLEQGRLEKALGYFEKAAESGSASGPFNAAIVLSELGEWKGALEKWQIVVAEDPTLQGYYDQMKGVLSGEGEKDFNYYYYRWEEFPAVDLKKAIVELNIKTSFVDNLWEKISRQLFSAQEGKRYAEYFNELGSLLSLPARSKAELGMAHFENGLPNKLTLSSNAFDELGTITYINQVAKSDTLSAYQLVINAANIHGESVLYQEQYFELALDLGLLRYAEDALTDLKLLLPPSRIHPLQEKFDLRKEELEQGF